jgi:hypothetical protein
VGKSRLLYEFTHTHRTRLPRGASASLARRPASPL